MKHYFRFGYWIAVLLNFGLKLQLYYLRRSQQSSASFSSVVERQSA